MSEESIEQEVLLERRDDVLIVTMNRPDVLNAMTPGLKQGMIEAFDHVAEDHSIRAVVVTGAGRAFCVGGYVPSFQVGKDRQNKEPWWPPDARQLFASRMARCDRPIIGAINGHAYGGGFGVALVCDIRIASKEAKFCVSQTKRGVPPDVGICHTLPQVVGLQKALHLIYTGEVVEAHEAQRLGLVLDVVPAEQLMEATMDLAVRVARGPTVAFASAKHIVQESVLQGLEETMTKELLAVKKCFDTEDAAEGVSAFKEGREPSFKGR